MGERASSPRTSPTLPPSAPDQPPPPRSPRLFQLGGQPVHIRLKPRLVAVQLGLTIGLSVHRTWWPRPAPALLNLKQCCENVRVFEIRILASSIEKQFVLGAFM